MIAVEKTITFKAIKSLSNENLTKAHKELKLKFLPRSGVIGILINELYYENKRDVDLTTIKSYLDMETKSRDYVE